MSLALLGSIAASRRRSGGGLPSYDLFTERFEGPGFQLSWTESGTTITDDYATSPAPLAGSYSLRLSAASTAPVTYHSFTASDFVSFCFRFRPVTVISSRIVCRLADGTPTRCVSFEVRTSDNKAVIRSGTKTAVSTNTFTAGNTYYVWLEYTKGTGANAVATLFASTDGTKTQEATITNSEQTIQASRVQFGDSGNATWEHIFDNVFGATTAIGASPT